MGISFEITPSVPKYGGSLETLPKTPGFFLKYALKIRQKGETIPLTKQGFLDLLLF